MPSPVSGVGTIPAFGLMTGLDLSAAHASRTKVCRARKIDFPIKHGESKEAGATYEGPEEVNLGPVDARARLDVDVWGQGLEHLWLSLCGKVTDAGAADPWTNTYAHLKARKYTAVAARVLEGAYVSVERPVGQSGEADVMNVGIDSVEVSWGQNERLQAVFEGIGGKYTAPASGNKTGSLTLSTDNPLPGKHGTTLTLDGVTDYLLVAGKWWVKRNSAGDGYNGTKRTRVHAEFGAGNEQGVDVGFEATVQYSSKTELQKFLDAAAATTWSDTAGKANTYACSVKTVGTTPGANERSLKLDLPKAALVGGDVQHMGRGVYQQVLRAEGLHNGTKMFDIIQLNSLAASTIT